MRAHISGAMKASTKNGHASKTGDVIWLGDKVLWDNKEGSAKTPAFLIKWININTSWTWHRENRSHRFTKFNWNIQARRLQLKKNKTRYTFHGKQHRLHNSTQENYIDLQLFRWKLFRLLCVVAWVRVMANRSNRMRVVNRNCIEKFVRFVCQFHE